MSRYNANERKPLTKSFLEGQKKVLVEFRPETVEQYWKDMEEFHSKEQIKEMRQITSKAGYEAFIKKLSY